MSDITLESTTSTQAELEHASSDKWREPFSPVVVEPEPEEGTSEADSEPAAVEQPTDKKPESYKGWQKRVDRLTARNKQIEAEAAELRAWKAEKEAAAKEPPPAAPKQAQDGAPKIEDFADANEWQDARYKWNRDQERKAEESEAREAESREVWNAHNERLSEARAKYEDFDEVAQSLGDVQIPQSAALAIVEQSNSADVIYHLATHLDEVEKIAAMRPMAQAAEIGRISDRLTQKVAPKPKPASQAPEPIRPVGGAATGTTVDPSAMSHREYMRWRSGGR